MEEEEEEQEAQAEEEEGRASRRKVDAVRQSWRSGEGEGRGRVSGLLHCLFTLIDDGPHTAGAIGDGLALSKAGATRHATAPMGNRGKETRRDGKMGGLNFYLLIPRVGSPAV